MRCNAIIQLCTLRPRLGLEDFTPNLSQWPQPERRSCVRIMKRGKFDILADEYFHRKESTMSIRYRPLMDGCVYIFCVSPDKIAWIIVSYLWVLDVLNVAQTRKGARRCKQGIMNRLLADHYGFLCLLRAGQRGRSAHWTSTARWGTVEFHRENCPCRSCIWRPRPDEDGISTFWEYFSYNEGITVREIHPYWCRCIRCKYRIPGKPASRPGMEYEIRINTWVVDWFAPAATQTGPWFRYGAIEGNPGCYRSL